MAESTFTGVQPWPERAELNPRAQIGGNEPPLAERIHADFREALLSEKPKWDEVLDRYLGKGDPNSEGYKDGICDRAQATDDESLGKCAEIVKALREAHGIVDAKHKLIKQPYLDGGRAVDAEANKIRGRIMEGAAKVKAVMDDYAESERLRKRREQMIADRQRLQLESLARENNLEAALPEAPPPTVKTEPVRSDGGATVSTTVDWDVVVTDYALAFEHVKNVAAVREAIDKAIKALNKTSKGKVAYAGVTITERAKTVAR